jgi:hypothetical protein
MTTLSNRWCVRARPSGRRRRDRHWASSTPTVDNPTKAPRRRPSDPVEVLTDHGQGRAQARRTGHVVEPNNVDVHWHADAPAAQRMQHTQRHLIVAVKTAVTPGVMAGYSPAATPNLEPHSPCSGGGASQRVTVRQSWQKKHRASQGPADRTTRYTVGDRRAGKIVNVDKSGAGRCSGALAVGQ